MLSVVCEEGKILWHVWEAALYRKMCTTVAVYNERDSETTYGTSIWVKGIWEYGYMSKG